MARAKIVRRLIRSVGARLLFLPKYSPDLNPIEQVFAKLKHLLRKAAARTVDAVCAAIGELLGDFDKDECANYFKNSGYGPHATQRALGVVGIATAGKGFVLIDMREYQEEGLACLTNREKTKIPVVWPVEGTSQKPRRVTSLPLPRSRRDRTGAESVTPRAARFGS